MRRRWEGRASGPAEILVGITAASVWFEGGAGGLVVVRVRLVNFAMISIVAPGKAESCAARRGVCAIDDF